MDKLEAKLRTQDHRLSEYKTLLKYAEKHRPEWYLKIIGDNDLDEFHHILWELPFYKRLYKVEEPTFINRVTTYIQPTDKSMYSVELFRFKVFKYRKNWLKGSYAIEKEEVDSRKNPELFEKYVEMMMTETPVQPNELPQPMLLNSI